MINLKLPTWFNNGQIVALKNVLQAWWLQVEVWVSFPLTQTDPETCIESILGLLAWQRDIDRFDNEPLMLYRLRVKYAMVNSKDAGSVTGIKRIFQRLGIGFVEVVERDPSVPWDVIILRLSDSQVSQNITLLQVIIKQYGRTCRRYQFEIIKPIILNITNARLLADYRYHKTPYLTLFD